MLKLVFRGDFSDAVRGWYGLVGGAIMMNLATNMVAPAGDRDSQIATLK